MDIGDRELYLWGSPLEMKKQDRIKTLRDTLTNQVLISAFEISPQQVPAIFARMKKFNPKCIFGYPSTIDLFCRMALNQGLHLKNHEIQVVFSTAEVLTTISGNRSAIISAAYPWWTATGAAKEAL